MSDHDVVVIGAGFGGLATALSLAEAGADVALCENLRYPGGCASTFSRAGLKFEAGATLFSGFEAGQPFDTWIRRHGMDIKIDKLDPIVELRTPAMRLDVPDQRHALVERFVALGGDPQLLRRFFAHQERVAGALWALFSDTDLLPPFGVPQLLRHLRRTPAYMPLLRLVGRPLGSVVERFGLKGFTPLETYLDAVCQITVQAPASRAEAPFALAATDYFFRGTAHVRGGVGELAWAMVRAIEASSGTVYMANRVKALRRRGDHWIVTTRRGEIRARHVVANLLPQDLRSLMDIPTGENATLDSLADKVERGWGAAMLYITARPPDDAGPAPKHLELVQDPSQPFVEGNHIFCSISGEADEGRAPEGLRTMTVSTHVSIEKLRALSQEGQASFIDGIHRRMRGGIEALAPAWAEGIQTQMTASPRTFARFTRRSHGCVGGIPRLAGLQNYRQLLPVEPCPGLFMVGDTVFPGQSTLATAIGGVKVAKAILSG